MDFLHGVPATAVAVVAVTLSVLLALVQWVAGTLRRWRRRSRIRARARRAVEGEALAAEWLERLGYDILGAQVVAEHAVAVDDELVTVGLRADYLVERAGRRFVVEVKTGRAAPRIETSATRRQLLEYRVAFDVDGVLLVDAEAARVQAVTFPRLERNEPRGPSFLGIVAFAALAAFVVALALAFVVPPHSLAM